MEQTAKDGKIAFYKGVDAALPAACPLADQGEGVYVGHEEPGEVAVPEVFVEPTGGAQLQKPAYLRIDSPDQHIPAAGAGLPIPEDVCQAEEDAVLFQAAVHQKARGFTVHIATSSQGQSSTAPRSAEDTSLAYRAR